jgi:hypothetical protein
MKMQTVRRCVSVLVILGFTLASAAPSPNSAPPSPGANGEEGGNIEYLPRIEQVFNTAVDKGVVSGASFINNSLDSLMATVFYNLLDQKTQYKINRFFSLNGGFSRQLFTTGAGNYIVVENFTLGPDYFRTIANLGTVPMGFGASSSIGVLNIYPRSDAQRTIEEVSFPRWKYWVSNWFGILTALERILPPSFNPNELYNPIEEVKTPFVFPFSKGTFDNMDTGAIRSYTFQGGISLPFGLQQLRDIDYKAIFKEFELNFQIPYTLFVQGEYRISVLKRPDHKAWVGLARTKSVGHTLAGVAGTTFMLLEHAFGKLPFAGIPADLSPIDVKISGAILDSYDLVYEFDLENPEGLKKYEKAVLGDFTIPRASKPAEGTVFHFQKDAVSNIKTSGNAKNFVLIYAIGHSQSAKDSEIRVRDGHREYFVLENTFQHDDREVNILVGENQKTITGDLILNVVKKPRDTITGESAKFDYVFVDDLPHYEMILQMQINDNSANIFNYLDYLENARTFTEQDLTDVPSIPLISEAQLADRRRRSLFYAPSQVPLDVRVTNTVLGKMNAMALVALSAEQITKILDSSADEVQAAFAKAFKRSRRTQHQANALEWLLSTVAYPLRVLNTKFVDLDAPLAIQANINALAAVTSKSTPVEILKAFSTILDTDYPLETIRGLYNLVDMTKVPRKVTFYIDPEKALEREVKKDIEKLNNRTYKAGGDFPPSAPFRRAEYKLGAFNPHAGGTAADEKLKITTAKIKDNTSVQFTVHSPALSLQQVHVYLKLATTAQLQLGELVLGKKVETLATQSSLGKNLYEFSLPLKAAEFTPLELLKTLRLTSDAGFTEGKQYILTLAISADQIHWSRTFPVYFKFEQGKFIQDKE